MFRAQPTSTSRSSGSHVLTWCHRWVRHARMGRSAFPAGVRHERAGSIGFALALPAILVQILIAAPHATERVVAVHAEVASEAGPPATVGADAGREARFHEPAQCPTCQAAAQGRTTLVAASSARALPLIPALDVVARASADLPATLARSTAGPRAPPV